MYEIPTGPYDFPRFVLQFANRINRFDFDLDLELLKDRRKILWIEDFPGAGATGKSELLGYLEKEYHSYSGAR